MGGISNSSYQGLASQYYRAQLRNATPKTVLDEALAYFRREGLSDEEIRKAMTPALFAAVAKKRAG